MEEGQTELRERAVSLTNSYTKQTYVMAEQIDQITRRIKHEWEGTKTPINLEQVRSLGLFPESHLLYASVFDGAGQLTTSTMLKQAKETEVNDEPYFQVHTENCCAGLHIGKPSANNLLTDYPVIPFSRRLNQVDGSFGGIALVSVDPRYLAAFQENSIIGHNDFIALRLQSGPVLTNKIGAQSENVPLIYREPPVFRREQGVRLEPGSKFHDGVARLVAWRKLEDYPLVTVSGLSVADAMAPYYSQASSVRNAAVAQSIVIVVFSALGTVLIVSLSRRNSRAEETKKTYRMTTDAAKEGFYILRPLGLEDGSPSDFEIEDCNNQAAELLGTAREKLLGTRVSKIHPLTYADELLRLLRAAHETGLVEEEVRVSPRSPLQAKWIYRRIVKSEAGLALTIRDISGEKMHEQMLADLANSDTLTKLPNRNWLNSFLPEVLRHADASKGHLAVLFIDLDNFKNVNDTLGHDAGDELLTQAAVRLKEAVRVSDHVVRLGGDEFIVILEQVEVEEDIARVAKGIVQAISRPYPLKSGAINDINASIGISLYPRDGWTADELLKHADIAMYGAKAAGKGRYMFYQSHLSDTLIVRLNKEHALKMAVERKEFIMHYQPRVDTRTGGLTSMEALIRWNRPQHGIVYPGEFIDTAEDIGLIVPIGELVIEQVVTQVARWKSEGVEAFPVSVNVSPQQLRTGTLSQYLADCIKRHGVDPRLIEIELTESAVIERSITVENELIALRGMGMKLMIDDFGTGYSSMAQMHRLDVDGLKVDKDFTRALSHGDEGIQLYRAIMSMAQALDMHVVAEGVETPDELKALQSVHCNEIQGFVVSEAVSAAEMTQMILKRFLYPSQPQEKAGNIA